MINTQLLDYVQQSLKVGSTIEQISSSLTSQGWSPLEINEALLKASEINQQKPVPPPVPVAPSKISVATPEPRATSTSLNLNISLSEVSASQLLLAIGGLIVVLAGVIYLGINWSQWSPFARILAVMLPMLVCYVAGSMLFFKEEHKKNGLIFLLVGSLLLPFFLFVLFKEMSFFSRPLNDAFNFSLFLATFIVYFASSYVYRFPMWSFLYHSVGLLVLYFAFKLFGISGVFAEPTMAWIFLAISTSYILLSWYYDRIGRSDEGDHTFMIGSVVMTLSFIRLFGESFIAEKSIIIYCLLGLGLLYVALGAFFEKKNYFKYCPALYLIGSGVVFFSLLRLGFDGLLFEDLLGRAKFSAHDLVGWSNLAVGVVYLLIAWSVSKLVPNKTSEITMYQEFFNSAGSLWVLGAIFYLGLGGEKFLYESLLLLTSIGFIFGSIAEKSRSFLYFGTLFLVIYIFSIGGEYFQNDAGWSLTLFVSGLLSMGIGVATERVRRRYFSS